MQHRRFLPFALLLVWALPGIAAPSAPSQAAPDVARATLANGLRVVVVRNALAPVVTTQMSYLVGSNEAPAGFPGTAHATEHMMFRGSPGLSQDQLAQIGALLGGSFNASTTQTVTQYYYTVPKADLDVALHIAALRMRGLDVTPADWDKERGAIEQEVSRDLSNPGYRYYKQLLAVLFKGTPYAHDALGTRASFDKTTATMLRDFHATWYAPNNAIFVIVGDVQPAKVLAEVKTLFASIPARKLPPRPTVALQPIKAERLDLTTDRPYGSVLVAWRFPGFREADFAASTILADALDSRRGRLNALVPEGKALAAGFDQSAFQGAGIGFASAVFAKGDDADRLLKQLSARVAEVRSKGVSADLVEAAKRQEIAAIERQKTSVSGLASAWSTALAFQGLDSPDAMKAAFAAVTVADVNRLARQILDPAHAVTAILTPAPSGKPVASRGFGGSESFAPKVTKTVELPPWAQQLTATPPVPDATLHPVSEMLPNGIRLIVQPTDVSGTVAVYGSIRTRPALQEPVGQEGVASVLGDLFDYGGGQLDRSAYQRALDEIAAEESGGTSFSLVVPAQHFDRGMQLLALNELQPRLPAQAFEVVRSQVGGALAGVLESPGYLSGRALREGLLPSGDPELRQATPKSVAALTLADVKAYYRQVFRPDLATIVVIGDVDLPAARRIVEKYFGAWKATGPRPDLNLPAVADNRGSTHWVPDQSAVQDSVTLAQTVPLTLHDAQRFPLELGNVLLGEGFYASRLYRDLRAERGLVYTVGSNLHLGETRGVYAIAYGSDPDKVAEARSIILRDLKDMQKTPVSAADLALAKGLVVRQTPLGQASFGGIARAWLYYSQHDLPLDQATRAARAIVKVSAPQVQESLARWLRPEDLVEVVRGPQPH
ncbi:MAG TPA: pitrilysin family protein [Nevskiaceae bacterium]